MNHTSNIHRTGYSPRGVQNRRPFAAHGTVACVDGVDNRCESAISGLCVARQARRCRIEHTRAESNHRLDANGVVAVSDPH